MIVIIIIITYLLDKTQSLRSKIFNDHLSISATVGCRMQKRKHSSISYVLLTCSLPVRWLSILSHDMGVTQEERLTLIGCLSQSFTH